MRKDGRMHICDRCGKKEFVETENSLICHLPADWEYCRVSPTCDLLCDSCSKQWEIIKSNFIKETKEMPNEQ